MTLHSDLFSPVGGTPSYITRDKENNIIPLPQAAPTVKLVNNINHDSPDSKPTLQPFTPPPSITSQNTKIAKEDEVESMINSKNAKLEATMIPKKVSDSPSMPPVVPTLDVCDLYFATFFYFDIMYSFVSMQMQIGAIQCMLENSFLEMRVSVHNDIQNLHLDMIRQFQVQMNQITSQMHDFETRVSALQLENEELRRENSWLRSFH